MPLTALYRLVQDRRVFAEPLAPAAAIAEVIACSPIVSAEPDRALALLARADRLVSAVRVQRLHFLPDPSFWAVISPDQGGPSRHSGGAARPSAGLSS